MLPQTKQGLIGVEKGAAIDYEQKSRSSRWSRTYEVSEDAAVGEAAGGAAGEGVAVGVVPRVRQLPPEVAQVPRVRVRVPEHPQPRRGRAAAAAVAAAAGAGGSVVFPAVPARRRRRDHQAFVIIHTRSILYKVSKAENCC